MCFPRTCVSQSLITQMFIRYAMDVCHIILGGTCRIFYVTQFSLTNEKKSCPLEYFSCADRSVNLYWYSTKLRLIENYWFLGRVFATLEYIYICVFVSRERYR